VNGGRGKNAAQQNSTMELFEFGRCKLTETLRKSNACRHRRCHADLQQ
jgi:hypothetical protein